MPTPIKQHQKTQRFQTLSEVEAVFAGFEAFIDITEQEISRPKNKRKRKTHYSVKKKKTRRKNLTNRQQTRVNRT